jgi:hypothetical protein
MTTQPSCAWSIRASPGTERTSHSATRPVPRDAEDHERSRERADREGMPIAPHERDDGPDLERQREHQAPDLGGSAQAFGQTGHGCQGSARGGTMIGAERACAYSMT